jgi:hypothetical protein
VHLLHVPTAPSAVGASFGVELGSAKLLGPCCHVLARGSEDAVLPAMTASLAVMVAAPMPRRGDGGGDGALAGIPELLLAYWRWFSRAARTARISLEETFYNRVVTGVAVDDPWTGGTANASGAAPVWWAAAPANDFWCVSEDTEAMCGRKWSASPASLPRGA